MEKTSETAATDVLEFLRVAERLKSELRHSWLSSGRRESVAEHCWQMALLAMLAAPHLETKVDLSRSIQMVLVHDIVEAIVGDIPFTEVSERKAAKERMEREAIDKLAAMLPTSGEHMKQLWLEFEERTTTEARFVKALDNLEVQIQHNFADLNTWEDIEFDLVYTKMDKYVSHDKFLTLLCDVIKADAEREMEEFGVDPQAIKQRAQLAN